MPDRQQQGTVQDTITAGSATAQLQDVIGALKQGLGDRLIAVVLFGSRARGDAPPESDWDLLLIADDLPARAFPRHLYVKKLLPAHWRGRVAVLAKTPAEFESHLPALFLDIALDGLVLYDTEAYMAGRLSDLRRLLARQGLQRERRGDDLIWQWREFPGYDWRIGWEGQSPNEFGVLTSKTR